MQERGHLKIHLLLHKLNDFTAGFAQRTLPRFDIPMLRTRNIDIELLLFETVAIATSG
jgi:hypothetical protein